MIAVREGEEIFEYNGGDTSSQFEQISAYKDSLKADVSEDDAIIRDKIEPEQAFGVFNGKLFLGNRDHYSFSNSVGRRIESPIERFSRLQAELAELESDLSEMVQVLI